MTTQLNEAINLAIAIPLGLAISWATWKTATLATRMLAGLSAWISRANTRRKNRAIARGTRRASNDSPVVSAGAPVFDPNTMDWSWPNGTTR